MKKAADGTGIINPSVKKHIPKVVDFIDIEDITEKSSLCRCWRSKNVSIKYTHTSTFSGTLVKVPNQCSVF